MSMELIDKRKAINHITACDGKSAQIEALENMPTVKAIPLEVVEQILSEIQSLRGCSCSCSDGIIDDVEDIIDKALKERNE